MTRDDRSVVAVVVTYRPDTAATGALLSELSRQVGAVVVVDNGSGPQSVGALREHADALAGVEVIALERNRGIGAAQNVGAARARRLGASFVLLSDQDSMPARDMVARLVEGHDRAAEAAAAGLGPPVGAVGPVTVDERVPGATLLFAARRWGPRRAVLPDADGALVPVVFLLASGCLIPVSALEAVGPMNEAWFIDHVDLEWGLRANRAGLALFGVTGAVLRHTLGDRTVRLPGRAREVHLHGESRNYYMARNTVLLVRSGLLPPAWRVGYAAWITKYAAFYVLAVPPRARRARELLAGLRDGVLGRTGPRRAVPAQR